MLLGLKSDLEDESVYLLIRKLTYKEFNYELFEVSSKNNLNVDKVFELIGNKWMECG